MRVLWLLSLCALVMVALYTILGGTFILGADSAHVELSPESRALAGTVLGIALSTIVSSINALLTEREMRRALKLTTTSARLELAVEMGVVHVLLHNGGADLPESKRRVLADSIKAASQKADAIASRLGEKHAKSNLAAQRLKLRLDIFAEQLLNDDNIEALIQTSEELSTLLRALDKG